MRPTCVIGIAVVLALTTDAAAAVLCHRKGNRLVLRPEKCRRNEARIVLDSETLAGKTPEELVAPLETRLQVLEQLIAVTTTTGVTTTTLELLVPARGYCNCQDKTVQSGCYLTTVPCTQLYLGSACPTICEGHGGALSEHSCDTEDPTCP